MSFEKVFDPTHLLSVGDIELPQDTGTTISWTSPDCISILHHHCG